ncbi:hypothetical protein A1O3_05799 [Capronia epimyces CBS 606.96]|uniref:SnoaL-like domain-containing protein n=1 Tax=Capronia epimyces CBS 606.96 TaxID=1182542 RepID=W9YS58_9EURO|nr:uncharacterized protein A1O3_05799 [Capronia epimyces CBS 606.96]EXJ85124.1 hypothetical protein A1O3_05799 [Capronia epimyces CBS 606.96]
MSIPTRPAYFHIGTWDDETRRHPAMKWMEDYTKAFNAREGWDRKASDWHASEYTLVTPDGSTYTDAEESFNETKAMYAPFTKEFHEPYFLVCWETSTGWEMLGQAHLFANCAGNPGPGEQKVKDLQGREWDVKIPGAFHFAYLSQQGAAHGGIELSRAEIMSDSLPAIQVLKKRGLIE